MSLESINYMAMNICALMGHYEHSHKSNADCSYSSLNSTWKETEFLLCLVLWNSILAHCKDVTRIGLPNANWLVAG